MTRAVAAAVLLALVAACAEPPDDRPSVLLVTIDTLRGDVVGPRDGGASLTPRLDDLAARGTRFTRATSVTPLTLPTHASMLTALRPARHGLTVNGVTTSDLAPPLLPATLREQGYATAAFVSAAVLDRRYGLADAFDHYDDDFVVPGGPTAPTERRGDATVDRALAWLDAADGPVFAWVHLFDPHAPYDAPGSEGLEDRRAAYEAEVAYADAQVGRLVDGLADAGPLLVVVTSDHGEGLGEHDEDTHGLLLYESTMHVPLSASWWGAPPAGAPFAQPSVVRDDLASVLDVAPTVLDVLGLDAPTGVDGVSLVQPVAADRTAPLETRAPWFYYGASALSGVRRGSEKVVGAVDASDPGYALTDVATDPAERAPLAVDADHPLARLVASPAPAAEARAVADRDTLQALGYVGVDAPRDGDGGARVDPRTIAALLRDLDRANTAIVEGDAEQALAILDALPAERRDVSEVLYLRGRAERSAGSPDLAVASLTRAAALQPSSAGILLELSRAWFATAEDARALVTLAAARGEEPDRAVAYEASRAAAEGVLALVPGDPDGEAQWALASWRLGDVAEALARLADASAARPRDVGLLTARLGILEALARDGSPLSDPDDERATRARLDALVPGG